MCPTSGKFLIESKLKYINSNIFISHAKMSSFEIADIAIESWNMELFVEINSSITFIKCSTL